ncbi:MAG: type II toxin-antitoxin system VapC family toxin [Methylocystis sp.]
MMIDASAMISILTGEAEGSKLADAIETAKAPYTTPLAVCETATALMRAKDFSGDEASALVRRFLDEGGVKVVMITESMAGMAIAAFDRYGKGRHAAGLNMRDCFAYAAAKAYRAPLLFAGDDYSRTDVNDREGQVS